MTDLGAMPGSGQGSNPAARPRVAVVVPAWQAEATIGETLASVLAQGLTDWELVVVDDGSTDGTAAIVEAVAARDARVRLIRQQHGGLPAIARNRGIRETSAPTIAFLDADDVWLPAKLALQAALLAAEPELGLVHCLAVHVSEAGQYEPELPATPRGIGAMLPLLAARNFIHNSAVLVRRELLDSHGMLDEDTRLRGNEDYELWLRLAPHTAFACIEQPLLRYRVHERGISNDRRTMGAGAILALEKAQARDPDRFAVLGEVFLRNVGIARCIAGLPGHGRRELIAALRRRPDSLLAWKWLILTLLPTRLLARLLP